MQSFYQSRNCLDFWKIATLKSLFKKGSTTNPLNYRPISLSYIHSTDLCHTFLLDKILKGFDKGLMTGMILIDLQKTFDTIFYAILWKRIRAIGFSNQTIDWFKSYLSNWLFRVNLSNLYCFSYTWMTCPKLLNKFFFYMLMTLALLFRERML